MQISNLAADLGPVLVDLFVLCRIKFLVGTTGRHSPRPDFPQNKKLLFCIWKGLTNCRKQFWPLIDREVLKLVRLNKTDNPQDYCWTERSKQIFMHKLFSKEILSYFFCHYCNILDHLQALVFNFFCVNEDAWKFNHLVFFLLYSHDAG